MLTARPLSIWDAAFCWRLAHDPEVRESAVDRSPPTWWGHCRWMLAWLFKRDREAWVVEAAVSLRYGVGEVENVRAGLARVQFGTEVVVSIEVLPEYRGKGVGLFGVQTATRYAEASGRGTPMAYIRADNYKSVALFAKAGYEMASATNGWVKMERLT